MSTEQQQYIIEVITDKEIQTITDRLFLDDTVDILEEMPSNVVKILKNTTKQKTINKSVSKVSREFSRKHYDD